MYLESTQSFMLFLAQNKGRVELHQKGLQLAIDAAKALFKNGEREQGTQALLNAEQAMRWLWELDMSNEGVMNNLEVARQLLAVAKQGGNPFASPEGRTPPAKG